MAATITSTALEKMIEELGLPDQAIQADEARSVREARRTLPEQQGRVIQLAYFGGFTHTQIAEMLDMPVGTVKGRMRLGLEKLRRTLTEEVA